MPALTTRRLLPMQLDSWTREPLKRGLFLYKVKNPDNVGSIYRLAHQFDIQYIIRLDCAYPGKTNTYQVQKRIRIYGVDCIEHVKDLIGWDTPVILLDPRSITPIEECPVLDKYTLAVGNESRGFGDVFYKFNHSASLGAINQSSYNVSHALAIALYQLNFKS